ncbi:hypothetical protein DFH09DRAFT_1089534 [Mycena vulgaris]|nr:hypothetical protein DFH09DRAFT_1089534 [Mycena vulgaris]
MFFAASIALTFVLSLSGIAVNSAPLAVREIVPQACTGPKGTGTCIPIKGNAECTNTPGIQSLVLNTDNDCVTFPFPNCDFDSANPAREQFADDSDNLVGVQSVECSADPAFRNGFAIGSEQDIEQQKIDAVAAQ